MSIQENYQYLKTQYQTLFTKNNAIANKIAMGRLATVVIALLVGYQFYKANNYIGLAATLFAGAVIFVLLLIQHLKYKEKKQFFEALTHINDNELRYLQGDLSPFKTGNAYIQHDHSFAYDLDIFGENTLFPHINRTTTSIGELQLAKWLKNEENLDIKAQQHAVRELGLNIQWRQGFLAKGQLAIDENFNNHQFQTWLDKNAHLTEKPILKIVSYLFPALTILVFLASIFSENPLFFNLFKGLFFINLVIVGLQSKHFKEEHRLLSNTSQTLKKYSNLLELIENQRFETGILRGYQLQILQTDIKASLSIHKLSRLLNRFDTILNPFVAILMNGFLQYHLHALFSLEKWKNQHKELVFSWFDIIGKFEALSSIGNFAYNHPNFIFPEITDTPDLIAQKVGHPLIPSEKMVVNDIAFKGSNFVVLTGSNMSGKSTFLRTLGVNIVLSKIGSPVCAERFICYPFNVQVSMRVSDSLQNSESFFFAELKRLKHIIQELEKPQKAFIILDEILRGTNSNDKRAGTQGLIHQLIRKNAVGIIATHDLVIGDMIKEYPQYLANKCFEAQILNDELLFDFKLRDGVCQQMSAAFLMEKMAII